MSVLISGSKQFDTLIVFLKEIFENNNFKKKSADDKKHALQNYPACKELKPVDNLEQRKGKVFNETSQHLIIVGTDKVNF